MKRMGVLITVICVCLSFFGCKTEQKVDFPADDAILLGSASAEKKVLVAFSPRCSLCQKLRPEMDKVVEMRPDIAFYMFLYPYRGAEDYRICNLALCAGSSEESLRILKDSEGWDYYSIPIADCGTERVERHLALLREKYGFPGTPIMILPSGKHASGAWKADVLIALIDGKAKQSGNRVYYSQ